MSLRQSFCVPECALITCLSNQMEMQGIKKDINFKQSIKILAVSWINHQKQCHHHYYFFLSNHTPVPPSILCQHSP